MTAVVINEVGLRDGLQNQAIPVSCDDKLRLARALVEAGVRAIEATSFVSPKAVPQMADADLLFPQLPNPELVAYSALVPNVRGLERAQAAGVREIALVLSATETMNRRNINMGLDEAVAVCEQTIAAALKLGMRAKAYVAVAFSCPFEGPTPADRVLKLGDRMLAAGAQEITIADTIGAAAPTAVAKLFQQCVGAWGGGRVSAHFHDTRALAVANAWAALQVGVRKFDASVGGLGGCPFAPGAAGNAATEDLVLMLEQCGFVTGISVPKLRQAVAIAGELVQRKVGGRTTSWLEAEDLRSQREQEKRSNPEPASP
ncbi:MAG: hydroxymethylglutaryl-CoA lyase [Proteobacteria bacterium]|nr:hydroxymethylglutaryl-CoA lyase [Pseudomonadota bacterium]